MTRPVPAAPVLGRARRWLVAEAIVLLAFAGAALALFVPTSSAPSDATGSAFLISGVIVIVVATVVFVIALIWLVIAALSRRGTEGAGRLVVAAVLAFAGGGVVVAVSPAVPFTYGQLVVDADGLDFVVDSGLSPIDGVRVVVPAGALGRPELELTIAQLNGPRQGTLGARLREDSALFAQFGDTAARFAADGPTAPFHPLWLPLLLSESDVQPFDAALRLGPEGAQFRTPVRVEIPLAALGMTAGTAVPPDLFALTGTESPDGTVRWELVSESHVDAAAGVLVVEATHFSRLIVYGVDVLDVLGRWGPKLAANARLDLANRVRIGSGSALAEAERGFVVQSTLAPFDPFAQATSCTGIAPREVASSVPPLGSLLAHLSGFADPNAISTPYEQALSDYILDPSRGERLTAAGIYARALQLSEGNVFEALLTAHEVLRSNFRGDQFPKRGVTSRPEEMRAQLMPMVGDGKDETGALYHFFGMAVYGYAQAYYQDEGALRASATALALPPGLIAGAEERLVSGDFWQEPRELLVDLKGGELGQRLRREVSGRPLAMLGANRLPPASDDCQRVLSDRQSEYAVLIGLGGTGVGAVASEPAGIACPGTCVALFPHGTSVVLAAAPTRGSRFDGWSGACAGTGPCTLALFRDQAATATFTPTTAAPAVPPARTTVPTVVPAVVPTAKPPTAVPTTAPTVVVPVPTATVPIPTLPRVYHGSATGNFGSLTSLTGCVWDLPFTVDLELVLSGSPPSAGEGSGTLSIATFLVQQSPSGDCNTNQIFVPMTGSVTVTGAQVVASLTGPREATLTFTGALADVGITGDIAVSRLMGTTSTNGDTLETHSASLSGVTLTRVE